MLLERALQVLGDAKEMHLATSYPLLEVSWQDTTKAEARFATKTTQFEHPALQAACDFQGEH